MQITSLFLHWYPACVVWTERWHPDVHSRENNAKTPEALKKWHHASFLEMALLPMVPYLIWAVLYYIKVLLVGTQADGCCLACPAIHHDMIHLSYAIA